MKYEKWLDEWLENYAKPSVKVRTYQKYLQLIRLHIAPNLGGYDMDDLNPAVYQKFAVKLLANGNGRTGEGLSPGTVNLIISILQGTLKAARAARLTSKYDADLIKRPKTAERTVESFSLAEQKKIEAAVLNDKRPKMFGIILCLYTGLRIGELLALEWNDLDLRRGTLSVSKSCYHAKNEKGEYVRIVDEPKTRQSRRIIPLPKQLLPRMRKMKAESDGGYVVSSEGEPVKARTYQKIFSTLLKNLNIVHRGFHALRHTFATRAIEAGTDVKTLSEILGHRNTAITLNRYVHSLTDHKREVMDRLGKFCGL